MEVFSENYPTCPVGNCLGFHSHKFKCRCFGSGIIKIKFALSTQEYTADALAQKADEGRDSLR